MCPSLPGHPRGGALHPRPGPAALRDARRARRLPITDGWRSTEVRDALDLCLACKGCKQRLPDAASTWPPYKAEFLAHHYAGRLRPRRALLDGLAARLGAARRRWRPALVNAPHPHAAASTPADQGGRRHRTSDRDLPVVRPDARSPTWFERLDRRGDLPRGDGSRGAVLLWPDTFTNHLPPRRGRAAVEVLEDAGFTVRVPAPGAVLRPDLDLHRPARHRRAGSCAGRRRRWPRTSRAGIPVVGLEPSLHRRLPLRRAGPARRRPGLERLAAADPHAGRAAAERAPDWQPPQLDSAVEAATAIVQMHCHQHAVLGERRRRRADEARRDRRRRARLRLLRAGRELRLRGAATTTCRWRAPANGSCCPRCAARVRRHRRARRRLQLPHPDRAGRHRPRTAVHLAELLAAGSGAALATA